MYTPWRAVESLVGKVQTIANSVAALTSRNAMARRALPSIGGALVRATIELVRVVATIVVVVAAPRASNAAPVPTPELTLGALALAHLRAHCGILVRAVATIVLLIAAQREHHTLAIATLEVARLVTLGTLVSRHVLVFAVRAMRVAVA